MAKLETAVSGAITVLEVPQELMKKHALEQFRTWNTIPPLSTQPRIAQTLNQGSGHTAVLVIADTNSTHQSYVLRYRNPQATALGLSFELEVGCMKIANDYGLAPNIVWLDMAHRSMVIEYLAESGPVSTEELAALVRSIHRLPLEMPTLNLQQQMRHYWRSALEQGNSPSTLVNPEDPTVQSAIKALESELPVTCHNDLTPPNIRRRHQDIMAIDWEYAAAGSPHFDIAALCAGWPDIHAESFAVAVLGDRFSKQQLRIATRFYATIQWNWNRAAAETYETSQSPDTLIQHLGACL